MHARICKITSIEVVIYGYALTCQFIRYAELKLMQSNAAVL